MYIVQVFIKDRWHTYRMNEDYEYCKGFLSALRDFSEHDHGRIICIRNGVLITIDEYDHGKV
jgi:hypothetical protein